jgi:hypothetical protein
MLREHMTIANSEFQALADATPVGMFSWAGSGPKGLHCYDCDHFDRVNKPRKPELPHRCNRWAAWYRATYGTAHAPMLLVPAETLACSAYIPRQEKPAGEAAEQGATQVNLDLSKNVPATG